MSGFDVMARSQQQVNQSQQFYDSQRYQMMAQTGQTIGQAPAMLQEIAVRQQDADMRLALQQQEFQSNAMKLQAMQAIDQADLMREQVRGAKLQNDAIEFDMKSKQEQMGMQREQMSSVRFERLVQSLGGGRGMLAAGIKVDPETQRFSTMNDDEKAAAAKGSAYSQQREDRIRLMAEYRIAEDSMDDEWKGRIVEHLKQNGGWNDPGSAQAPKAKVDPAAEKQRSEQVSEIVDMLSPLTTHKGMESWQAKHLGVAKFQKDRLNSIASFMVENQQALHDAAVSASRNGRKNMMVGETPRETVRMYMAELLNRNSVWRQKVVEVLLTNGVMTPDEAQSILSQ